MTDSWLTALKGVLKVHSRYDDDLVDRLHHRYTVSLLVVSAVLVTTTQYIGTPIHCWCPAYFTENHQHVRLPHSYNYRDSYASTSPVRSVHPQASIP